MIKFFKRFHQNKSGFTSGEEEEEQRKAPSKVGVELADLVGKRVIIGMIAIIFLLPQFEVTEINQARENGLELLETSVVSKRSVDRFRLRMYSSTYGPSPSFCSRMMRKFNLFDASKLP